MPKTILQISNLQQASLIANSINAAGQELPPPSRVEEPPNRRMTCLKFEPFPLPVFDETTATRIETYRSLSRQCRHPTANLLHPRFTVKGLHLSSRDRYTLLLLLHANVLDAALCFSARHAISLFPSPQAQIKGVKPPPALFSFSISPSNQKFLLPPFVEIKSPIHRGASKGEKKKHGSVKSAELTTRFAIHAIFGSESRIQSLAEINCANLCLLYLLCNHHPWMLIKAYSC
jgi:hypothetical protein